MVDDPADDRGLIAGLRQLVLGIVATAGLDARQVRLVRRGVDRRRDQVPAGDELTRRRDHDDLVVRVAESTAVSAVWRGGQAEVCRRRVVLCDLDVRGRQGAVGLVGDHDVGRRAVRAPGERGDRCDLDTRAWVAPAVLCLDHAEIRRREPGVAELGVALVNKLRPVCQENHGLASPHRASDNARGTYGLAATCRRDK